MNDFKGYVKLLQILFMALLIGQLFLGSVFWFLSLSIQPSDLDGNLDGVFQYLVPLMILATLIISRTIRSKRLELLQRKVDIKEKMKDYKSLFITRFAILEASSIFAMVAFFLTHNNTYLIFAAVIILVFILERPVTKKIAQDLGIDSNNPILQK